MSHICKVLACCLKLGTTRTDLVRHDRKLTKPWRLLQLTCPSMTQCGGGEKDRGRERASNPAMALAISVWSPTSASMAPRRGGTSVIACRNDSAVSSHPPVSSLTQVHVLTASFDLPLFQQVVRARASTAASVSAQVL